MCKLGMTKSELRRLAAVHPRFFSFRARAVRPKLLLLRTEVCIPLAPPPGLQRAAWFHLRPCCGQLCMGTPKAGGACAGQPWTAPIIATPRNRQGESGCVRHQRGISCLCCKDCTAFTMAVQQVLYIDRCRPINGAHAGRGHRSVMASAPQLSMLAHQVGLELGSYACC